MYDSTSEKPVSGRVTIPLGSIGKNAYIIVEEDFPRYFDNYMSQMNFIYVIKDILGKRMEHISQGDDFTLNRLTRSSPLQNLEGEQILRSILLNSSIAQIWQPKVIDTLKLDDKLLNSPEDFLKAVNTSSSGYKGNLRYRSLLYGTHLAQKEDFIIPTIYEENIMLLPSQKFVEYIIQRQKELE